MPCGIGQKRGSWMLDPENEMMHVVLVGWGSDGRTDARLRSQIAAARKALRG